MGEENNHEPRAGDPMIYDEDSSEIRQPKSCGQKTLAWCKKNLLLVLTVLAVLLGILFGFCIRLVTPGAQAKELINFPGVLLIRMLKMLIIPLIVSSLISGLAQLHPKSSGKMGSKALLYYAATTLFAIIIGIVLVVTMHPGNPALKDTADKIERDISQGRISTLDAMLDLVRNLFPDNIVAACFQQVKTKYKDEIIPDPTMASLNNTVNGTTAALTSTLSTTVDILSNITTSLPDASSPNIKTTKELTTVAGMNVLGIICFCIVFGMVLSKNSERAQLLVKFFTELSEVIMNVVEIIMWYSPVGILFLVMGNIIAIPNLATAAATLGMYMLTVMIGLAIHAVIVLPLIYLVICRQNPFVFYKGMLQAWLTALGTASSSATLPVTFRCLEENNGIDKRVTRFVLPVGATVNMDGTALYEAVAAIFIAQLNGIVLSFGEIVVISLTATLASVGAASIPSAGLVTMVMVLLAAGLPPEDIGYIFTVDWLLDRFRTSVNVLGDSIGAGIVYHMSRDDLRKEDEEHRRATLQSVYTDDNDNTKGQDTHM